MIDGIAASDRAISYCTVTSLQCDEADGNDQGVRGSGGRDSANRTLVDDIRDFVRGHLARYEVPHAIVFVPELPMTTTGKILRRQLRDAERTKKTST